MRRADPGAEVTVDATARRRATYAVALAPLLLIPAADVALGPDQALNGSYALAALTAAALGTVRFTALTATAAVALSLASVAWNGGVPASDYAVRLVLSACLAALAVVLARLRVRREEDLRQMTLIADVAQQALLRSPPERVGSVSLAARYVSASRLASVGGDLYDITPSPYGLRVIVGDVRGKGLTGVQLAGTVLGAFRRAAGLRPSLIEVAQTLDGVVAAVATDEEFVTAVLVELRDDGTMSVVSCGHPPPLLVGADGSVTYLRAGEDHLPLGLGPAGGASTHPWPEGSRLLLYTDGLVEARDRSGAFFPLDDCAPLLVEGALEPALDELVAALDRHTSGEVGDDVALLLAERAGEP